MTVGGEVSVGIVGAGPAGSAAAIVLARSGLSVDLIDRWAFPRDKVCGDALSAAAIAHLAELGLEELAARTRTLTGSRSHADLFESLSGAPTRGDVVHMIRRREFDHALVEAAEEAGARLLHGRVEKVGEESDGRPTVAIATGDEGRVDHRYDYVVGADGAGSIVARSMGLHPGYGSYSAYSMRTYLQRDESSDSVIDLIGAEVIGLPERRGFAWVLPMNDGALNVGVYVHGADGARWVPDALDRVIAGLERHGVRPVEGGTQTRGGWIRHDFDPLRAGRGRVLLAGDAAGLSSAVTGEGIGFALGSGMLAAGAIVDHHRRSVPLGTYSLLVEERFGGWLRNTRRSIEGGSPFARPVSSARQENANPSPFFGPGIVVVHPDGREAPTPLEAELRTQLEGRSDLLTVLDVDDARSWGIVDGLGGGVGQHGVAVLFDGGGRQMERIGDLDPGSVAGLLRALDGVLDRRRTGAARLDSSG